VHLYRPSSAGLDQKLKLEPDAKGVQTIDAAKLLPGLWEVRVFWTADRRDYFISRKVYVEGSEARS
jgi:nitrogen fixation protein FixH